MKRSRSRPLAGDSDGEDASEEPEALIAKLGPKRTCELVLKGRQLVRESEEEDKAGDEVLHDSEVAVPTETNGADDGDEIADKSKPADVDSAADTTCVPSESGTVNKDEWEVDLEEAVENMSKENSGVLVSRPIEVSVSVPENNTVFHFGNMNLY